MFYKHWLRHIHTYTHWSLYDTTTTQLSQMNKHQLLTFNRLFKPLCLAFKWISLELQSNWKPVSVWETKPRAKQTKQKQGLEESQSLSELCVRVFHKLRKTVNFWIETHTLTKHYNKTTTSPMLKARRISNKPVCCAIIIRGVHIRYQQLLFKKMNRNFYSYSQSEVHTHHIHT